MAVKWCATVAQAVCYYNRIRSTRRDDKKLIGKRPIILENTENKNAIRWTENGLKVKKRTGKKEGNKPKNTYTIENTASIPERLVSVLSQLTRESFFLSSKTMSFHSEMRPSTGRGRFTRIHCKEIISRVKKSN